MSYLIPAKYFPVSHNGDLSRHVNAETLEFVKVYHSAIVDVNKIPLGFTTGTVT